MIRSLMFLLAVLAVPTLLIGCPDDGDDDDSTATADDYDATADDDDDDDDDDDAGAQGYEVAATGLKRLLLEEFTNTSCGPCADQNPTIDAFLEEVGVGNVVPVKVHTDWPGVDDLFYVTDPDDCDARIDYYGVDGVPTTIIEGLYDLTWHGGNYYSDINAYFAGDLLADLGLTLYDNLDGTYDLDVHVTATEALDETREVQLRVMAVKRYVEYATAPGSNGETEFHDPVIGFLPDGQGTTITLEPGYAETVSLSHERHADWDSDELHFVAFLQDDDTREVLQVTTTETPPLHSFRMVETAPEGVILEVDESRSFEVLVQNVGPFMDAYDLFLEGDVPQSWSVTWTVDGAAIEEEMVTVKLSTGDTATVILDVDPAGNVGSMDLALRALPHCEEWPEIQVDIGLLTYGADVLLVDADGGDDYETYFQAALDEAGVTQATWSSDVDFETIDLDRFETVIWNAGWYFPHFLDDEKTALTDYLDNGGRVFFSGQDIGWDLSEDGTHGASESPWLDQEWYEATMHAEYMADEADSWTLSGVPGDPIATGLVFDISGGDGADNQQYPSWVEPLGPDAEPMLNYDNDNCGGVRALHGDGKVVYISFGFEAIADADSRNMLMERVLDWFAMP